jgi:hypothetical protein
MCRRSAWRWRASGRAADGGDRLGGPGGRLSFAFLEAAPFRRWAVRSTRTYRQVSQDTGVPLETLGAVLESMGFARMGPDEPMREDELEVVPLLQLGLSSGTFDLAWLSRLGRAHVDGLRLLATAWTEATRRGSRGWRWSPGPTSGPPGAGRPAGRRLPAAGGPRAAGRLPPPARAGLDRAAGRGHRGCAGRQRRARPARAGASDVLPGPGGLHPADRGARRPGRRRAGGRARRAGRAVLAGARRGAGEVAGRRGDGPPPGAGRGGPLRPGAGRAAAPRPACRRPTSASRPGRWSPRAATTSAAP